MAELHETIMGRKLIEHTLPEIAEQLKRIADALENANKREEKEIRQRISKDMTDIGPM
jgi:hypothetical protein